MPNVNTSSILDVSCIMSLEVQQSPPFNTPIEALDGWNVGQHSEGIFVWFDGTTATTGDEKICHYYNGDFVGGVYHFVDFLDLDRFNSLVFRNTTDRNKGLLEQLKRTSRTYKVKTFFIPDVCKAERYYDYKKFKWRWKPVLLAVQRLVPEKRDLKKILKRHRDRLSNDLSFESVTLLKNGEFQTQLWFDDNWSDNQFSLLRNAKSDDELEEDKYLLFPDFKRFFTLNVRGSALAFCAPTTDDLFIVPSGHVNNEFSLTLPWGLEYPGTGKPSGWIGTHSSGVEDLFDTFTDAIANEDEKCLGKLYSRVKNAKLDLATDLAEISQTVGLISKLAVQLGKAFFDLKKGSFLNAIKNLFPSNRGQVADAFLAYRYGISPLMSDIKGAAEFVAERLLELPPIPVKAKRRRRIVTTEVFNRDPDTLLRVDTSQPVVILTKTTVIDVKYSVTYAINGTETISNLSRLGFTSPANVAWELIPFSFVLDWFLPIGNFLGSLSACDGYTVKEITRTCVVRHKVSCDYNLPASEEPLADLWHNAGDIAFVWEFEMLKVRRQTLPSLPSLPFPRFKNPFSFGHLANAVALLTQLFKGK